MTHLSTAARSETFAVIPDSVHQSHMAAFDDNCCAASMLQKPSISDTQAWRPLVVNLTVLHASTQDSASSCLRSRFGKAQHHTLRELLRPHQLAAPAHSSSDSQAAMKLKPLQKHTQHMGMHALCYMGLCQAVTIL
jgi:hypothetical protein